MPLDCDLALVVPPGTDISVPLGTPAGVRELMRGSLVRRLDETCLEVVSVAGWYTTARPAAPRDTGCVPAPGLTKPVTDEIFVALSYGDGLHSGDVLGPLVDRKGACRFAGTALDVTQLRHVRAVAPAVWRDVEAVRAAYGEHFGELLPGGVPWTDTGRVGLPMTAYSPAELAKEWEREGLSTPTQREKAVAAEGPAWTHFWGADLPWTDVWARPDTLVRFFALARGWAEACGDAPGCVLSVGDLSWYDTREPDPLGHVGHDGDCVDLRLFRSDGSRYEAFWNQPDDRTRLWAYDRARTIEFLRWATAHETLRDVFFNDPEVIAAVPGVNAQKGHDDHVHLCFGEPSAAAGKR
ncbi:MAG: hypothetical protein ACOZNI_22920 [Myxococcota bacterium]